MKHFFRLFFIFLFALACDNHSEQQSVEEIMKYKEPLVKVNKILVDKDSLEIASYNNRHKIGLSVTGSGLWYRIYKTGSGDSAKTGNIAEINYKVHLLNGKLCYSSDSTGSKKFKIGYGGIETGIDIGIRMMRRGDKAKFVLPPNLAHGLLGDQNKIPARSIIVYDVELVGLYDD